MSTMKILVVSDNCPSCESVKAYMGKAGILSKIRVVNVASNEGRILTKKLNLMGVPDCVLVDDQSKTVRVCSDQEWHDMLEGK